MINFIKGKLKEINENSIVVENSGIGYEMFFPKSNMLNLPDIEVEVEIYTYMVVKEDDISLFGFLTKEDKQIFLMLISVNGLGPKGALNIISELGFSVIIDAVINSDDKVISNVSGIGKKTAGKIIIELKDKMKKLKLNKENDIILKNNNETENINQTIKDTIEALVALEIPRKTATDIVSKIEYKDGMNVNDMLKIALKSRSK